MAALSKGKLQDNNEFMQWFKGYWDSVTGGYAIEDYDPVSRRQICKTGDWKKVGVRREVKSRLRGGQKEQWLACDSELECAHRGDAPIRSLQWSAGSVSSSGGAGPRPAARAPPAAGGGSGAEAHPTGVSAGSRAGVGASFTKVRVVVGVS